jgi:hypothetical protein
MLAGPDGPQFSCLALPLPLFLAAGVCEVGEVGDVGGENVSVGEESAGAECEVPGLGRMSFRNGMSWDEECWEKPGVVETVEMEVVVDAGESSSVGVRERVVDAVDLIDGVEWAPEEMALCGRLIGGIEETKSIGGKESRPRWRFGA